MSDSSGWVPIGLEGDVHGSHDSLHEGIPHWMTASFWLWVTGEFSVYHRGSGTMNPSRNSFDLDKLRRLERTCRIAVNHNASHSVSDGVLALRTTAKSDHVALRVADFLLGDQPRYGRSPKPEALETILLESGSAWRVGTRDGRTSLVRRVPQGVQDAADAVMRSGQRAGARLAEAWSAVFGVDPDPSRAYNLVVKAVEDAAIPATIPKDNGATLGKVISHLRDVEYDLPFQREHKDTAGSEVLKQMCQLIWTGQVDRHGGTERATGAVTQEAAEAAVVLAVPLVQWFTSGKIRRPGAL